MHSPTVYLIFSAFAVTSTTISNNNCVRVAGPEQTLSPALSFLSPTAISNGASLLGDANNSLLANIGLPSCSPGDGINTITQVSSTTQTPSLVTVGLGRNGTEITPVPGSVETTDGPSDGLGQRTKIAIGVAVPLGCFAIAALGFLLVLRYRRRQGVAKAPTESPDSTQIAELQTESYIAELPRGLGSIEIDGLSRSELEEQKRHELAGKDYAQELEA